MFRIKWLGAAVISLVITLSFQSKILANPCEAERSKRTKINSSVELNNEKDIFAAVYSAYAEEPDEKDKTVKAAIEEPLFKKAEAANCIKLERGYMVSIRKCINAALQLNSHLIHISTGSSLTGAKFTLVSDSNTKSIWDNWKTRKLQGPVLTVEFYYNNSKEFPTMLKCERTEYQ
ncbi:MAG: hypothetical protein MJE63_07065 [Proteobacteria bacterium]|nr:hypothetical protein [Pseudomonadota bacterium]